MSQRSLLCIEPDGTTVSEIRRSFGAYGFRVESIPNGEQAVEWARTHNPALIILSVEPRKVGYAICNKLKRSPSLREIPLVLISAEETMATFEQHKKLKSRAEEYLLKPLDMNELLAKAGRMIELGVPPGSPGYEDNSGEIEIADDEIAEVSLDEEEGLLEETEPAFPEGDNAAISVTDAVIMGDDESSGVPQDPDPLRTLGDLSKSVGKSIGSADSSGSSPFQGDATGPEKTSDVSFEGEQFDQETQEAFAALEAGATEGGEAGAAAPDGRPQPVAAVPVSMELEAQVGDEEVAGDMVDLQSLWGDEELPVRLPWEEAPAVPAQLAAETTNHDIQFVDASRIAGEDDPRARQVTPPPRSPYEVSAGTSAEISSRVSSIVSPEVVHVVAEESLLADLGTEVPPLPEEVLYHEQSNTDAAVKEQRISELQAHVDALEAAKGESESRAAELQARIASLETERQTLRKEQDEQRERMTQAANQGAFSKERDLLNLREIINKKEKDILDLRDALDAKERLMLDHKDKIREHERARRDLEERTLGFEKNLVAANEKVGELIQDKEKSVEREKGLKARLDDAHEELRKGQDEIEALRKRITQEIERGRIEVERTRIELEAKLAEAEDAHRATLSKATDEWAATEAAQKAANQGELARLENAHRAEVEALQRRLGEEVAAAAERLQSELLKLRRDHEKTVASLKEEQSLQLASERDAYETQAEAKHRAYRDEVLGLRRRHEEELAAAEDRRQRDILEQEQRRVVELEQAENRRRSELQGRDEEHHARVTELERRHLIENTELAERHRTEHDQAVGRAVRAEGELVARAQEIEQAYRRLAGFEADLDAARVELGDRDLKLSQMRDRIGELDARVTDYEDQIVRAFQRLRADERTTEKVRRALAVGLALLDERAAAPAATAPHKPAAASEEAEKS